MKQCTACLVEKDESEFHFFRKGQSALRPKCKVCTNAENSARQTANPEKTAARTRKWRAAHPGRANEISRAWQLRHPEQFAAGVRKYRYNIDFPALWEEQKGICASCQKPMLEKGKEPESVCVDHDKSCCPGHKSCGTCFRGLIHRNCNLVLGYAKDDIEVLKAAVAYLERTKKL